MLIIVKLIKLIIITLLFSKEKILNRLKKIVLIVLIVSVLSSCTGIGVGVGIPVGPVNIGVGTTLKVPKSKNRKAEKKIKDAYDEDIEMN